MDVVPRARSSDTGKIVGISQGFKKAARVAHSFSANRPAQELAQTLLHSQSIIEGAYDDGRTRCGDTQFEALSGDASIIKELQDVKLALLELTETLRDYSEEPDQFHAPPFSILTKSAEDLRNRVLAVLNTLSPRQLLVSQKRLSVPPTPPPKDDNYVSAGSFSQGSSDAAKEWETDPSWTVKSAAQFALPSINTNTRSASPKATRRMAYISDPKSATSRSSSSSRNDRADRRSAYIWDVKAGVENREGMQNWIAEEDVDHQVNINEEWLHQRKMSRIAFRASFIASEYSASSSPRASLASMVTSPRFPPANSPLFNQESFTAATSVTSEDFSRWSLGKLNPSNLIYDHNENKIVFLDRPEQKCLPERGFAETKPIFNRRGASEEHFRFGASSKIGAERELEGNSSPRTTSLPIFGLGIEDGIQILPSQCDTSLTTQVYEDGLMLADEIEAVAPKVTAAMSLRSTDDKTLSITPNASFYQFGGFCSGALMLQNSQPGAFKICKKPSGNYNATIVGKCTKCAYEVPWQIMEKDRLNDISGISIHASGIRWRFRFLQKCHLSVKNLDEALYACIFCIEEGQTLEASDATVFFSSTQLLRHLEKHLDIPRKKVKVNVLTGFDDIDADQIDIHFPDRGRKRLQDESESISKRLEGMASGVASASHGPKFSGFKIRDPDGAPSLQFAKGARILGITFPPRFSGAWASGHHDGMKSYFPSHLVLLDPPTAEDMIMSPKSSITATARWDFKPPKDSTNWLPLSKRDKISNVGYAFEEFWCWSGQNSKGRWGLFPRDFVAGVVEKEVPDPLGGLGGLVPLSAVHSRGQSRSGVLGWVAGHKYSSSQG